MTLHEAVESSIKGGFLWHGSSNIKFHAATSEWVVTDTTEYGIEILFIEKFLLSPSFWQCLGKNEGWDKIERTNESGRYVHYLDCPEDLYQMHRLIDHIASGGSYESFFNTI